MSSAECGWTRPASVPVPTVWRRVQGRRPLTDGKVPTFVIQDVPPELDDAVLEHMCEHFLRDEPLCSTSGVRDDPVSLREVRELWANMLQRRTALVALVEQPGGAPPRVAGANVTMPLTPDFQDDPDQYKGGPVRKVLKALHHVESLVEPDLFTRYGVSACLSALGLSVDPEFRGQGLGQHLLEARWDLCRALGLPLTATLFTAKVSQVLAARVGFETLVEVRYDEYGDPDFVKSSTDSMIYMAARID